MNYETDISIQQYSSDGNFYYRVKVTDVMNMDHYCYGNSPTLDDVMAGIKLYLKQYQN